MKKWFLTSLLMLLSWQTLAAQPAGPELTSKNFYSWYLTALSKDESPIDEHDPLLGRYITSRLLQKINLLIKSPEGMEDDFFLQDQDYSDSWPGHVSVGQFTINGDMASGNVTLGDEAGDQKRLLVTLHRDAQGWRIDDIEKQ